MSKWTLLLAFSSLSAWSSAQLLYDSQGFEPPLFVPGGINGQDNWSQIPGEGPIDIMPGIGLGLSAGAHASHPGGVERSLASRSVSAQSTMFTIDFDFKLNDDWFNGLTAISNYIFEANVIVGPGPNDFFGIGGLRNNNTDAVLISVPGGSNFSPPVPLESLIGQYHHLHFHWETGNGQALGFLDGVFFAGTVYGQGTTRQIQGIDFQSWRINNGGTNGSVDFDNLVITSVPEPGAFAAMALGACALLSRRRRK